MVLCQERPLAALPDRRAEVVTWQPDLISLQCVVLARGATLPCLRDGSVRPMRAKHEVGHPGAG